MKHYYYFLYHYPVISLACRIVKYRGNEKTMFDYKEFTNKIKKPKYPEEN